MFTYVPVQKYSVKFQLQKSLRLVFMKNVPFILHLHMQFLKLAQTYLGVTMQRLMVWLLWQLVCLHILVPVVVMFFMNLLSLSRLQWLKPEWLNQRLWLVISNPCVLMQMCMMRFAPTICLLQWNLWLENTIILVAHIPVKSEKL